VPGILDDDFAHVVCRGAHHDCRRPPERLLPTNRQHWQLEAAMLKKCAIIDRILVEREELLEPGAHVPRSGVKARVMTPCGLGELLWIGRELIPKAIEIDALAAGHEAFHVGPAKVEMPEKWILQDIVPRPDTRDRRVHQDETFGTI